MNTALVLLPCFWRPPSPPPSGTRESREWTITDYAAGPVNDPCFAKAALQLRPDTSEEVIPDPADLADRYRVNGDEHHRRILVFQQNSASRRQLGLANSRPSVAKLNKTALKGASKKMAESMSEK